MNYRVFTDYNDAKKFQKENGGIIAYKSKEYLHRNRLYNDIASNRNIDTSTFPYVVWGYRTVEQPIIDHIEIRFDKEELAYQCSALGIDGKTLYQAEIPVTMDLNEWACLVFNDMGK